MSLVTTLADLADLVRDAGYDTFDHVPARIVPPVVLLIAGDPYVEPGDTYNRDELTVNVQLHLIAASARNDKATAQLNRMIDAVTGELAGSAWMLDTVSPPFVGRVDDREFLAARVNTTTEYERNTP